MFCTKCGNELLEGASFCTKCGFRVGDVPKQQMQTQPMYKKCAQCGTILAFDAPFCTGCGGSFYGQRKRESVLSILADAFTGIAFLLPMPIIIGCLIELTAFVLAFVDLGIKDKTKSHKCSVIAIILAIIYFIVILLI